MCFILSIILWTRSDETGIGNHVKRWKKRVVFTKVCGEFRWSPKVPVSQIHSFHLQVGTPRIFSDPLRSLHMLKREWGVKATGSYRTYSIPGKTAALVPEFAVEDLPSAELQHRFRRLQWRTCPCAELSNDDDLWIQY